MSTLLAAKLELGTEKPALGEPVRVHLTITNNSDEEIEVANPEVGVPPPGLDWKASNQAYRIAVLLSFGLMKLALNDSDGRPVKSKGLMPWVTPSMGKRVLQPQEGFTLDFDLNELFSLDSAGPYRLQVRYGDEAVHAEAGLDIEIRKQS